MLRRSSAGRKKDRAEDASRMESLARAAAEMADIERRSERAVRYLVARHQRNHWKETVDRVIQGGTT